MLAVRTPGAPQATRNVARPAIPPSPLRDRVGYSDHDRFRGYFPVHFIPAYNLPVYASQWPLPDPHARLGSRLLARLYRGRHLRRQSSTHLHGATRIEPYGPNSGIRLVWGSLCQACITPFFVLCYSILLFDPRREHSSAPTADFRHRRAQRRSRTALLQRRRRPVLDGREHGGRLPAIGWSAAQRSEGSLHWPRAIARTTLVFG